MPEIDTGVHDSTKEWLTKWIRDQALVLRRSPQGPHGGWRSSRKRTIGRFAVPWRSARCCCPSGAHELYQLALAEHDGEVCDGKRSSRAGRSLALLDAVETGRRDPGRPRLLSASAMFGEDPAPRPTPVHMECERAVRGIGGEQSNTSIVFDNRFHPQAVPAPGNPGSTPSWSCCVFLTAHGYPHIAPLHGWYEYEGENRWRRRWAILQEFVGRTGFDGWELALGRKFPAWTQRPSLARLGSLGVRHGPAALGPWPSDSRRPRPSPRRSRANETSQPAHRGRSTMRSSGCFGRMPDDPELMEIANLAELGPRAPAYDCRRFQCRRPQTFACHGDFHLGQTMSTSGTVWTLASTSEGEPARSLTARPRQALLPLRDVRPACCAPSPTRPGPSSSKRGPRGTSGLRGAGAGKRFLGAYLQEVEADAAARRPGADSTNQLAILRAGEGVVRAPPTSWINRPGLG